MLAELMETHREELLERSHRVLLAIGGSPRALEGLGTFYDQIIGRLHANRTELGHSDPVVDDTSRARGASLQKMGVTIGQVVRSYGAICDGVTTLAMERGIAIHAEEFNILNRVLDEAIASAVGEHARLSEADAKEHLVEHARDHLGSLAHELRNAAGVATMALGVLKESKVGVHSSTGRLLERGLLRVTALVDRSLAEVRLERPLVIQIERFDLVDLLNEAEATASLQAAEGGVSLRVEVEPDVQMAADRQLMVSAVSNLLQNAIKYSETGGVVRLIGRAEGDHIVIEVHDQCGGLPPGKTEELFEPFVRKSNETTGLGLGLTIAHRAITANGGSIHVRNDAPTGCVFSIEQPARLEPV
jgi:signal transduction histidine kinase